MMKYIAFTLTLFFSLAVQAAGFEFIGPHGEWDVFADKKSKASVCYIASIPTSKSHADKRGDIYVLITKRKSEGFKDVVSFQQGYPLKEGKDVSVTIGKAKFNLFPSDDTAWTYDTKDDAKLVMMMKAGSTMQVEGLSSRGTQTKDTYSLNGISAAYKAMEKACS